MQCPQECLLKKEIFLGRKNRQGIACNMLDFRFYGHQPNDWIEGANQGHAFEVQFGKVPDEDQKAGIADLFEEMMLQGAAEPSSEPWLWSKQFVLFRIGERGMSPGAVRSAFKQVSDFLKEVHRLICPIEDLVFWGCREPSGTGWETASIRQKAQPDAGPRYPFEPMKTYFAREVNPELPIASPNSEFEARRKEARDNAERKRRKEQLKSMATDGPVGLAEVHKDQAPDPFSWPEEVLQSFNVPDPLHVEKTSYGDTYEVAAPGDHPLGQEGRPLALVYDENDQIASLAYLDDAGIRKEVSFPDGQSVPARIRVSSDGQHALAAEGFQLFDIDFSTGVATPRWMPDTNDGRLRGVGYAENGLWAVKTDHKLHVLDPSTPRIKPVASVSNKELGLVTLRNGTVFITTLGKSSVFVFAGKKLKKLAQLPLEFWGASESMGRIYLHGSGYCYELTHIDEAYQTFASSVMKKESAQKKDKGGRAKASNTKARRALSFNEISATDVPKASGKLEPSEQEKSLFGSHATVLKSTGGTLIAGIRPEAHSWGFRRLAICPPGGQVIDLREQLDSISREHFRAVGFSQLSLSQTGKTVFLQGINYVLSIELESRVIRPVYKANYDEGGNIYRVGVLGEDALVILREKRLDWIRKTDDGWHLQGHAKTSGGIGIALDANQNIVAVLSENKARLQVFALRDEGVLLLGKTTDRVDHAEFRESRLIAWTSDGFTLEVEGIKEVAEKKAATARTKKAKE